MSKAQVPDDLVTHLRDTGARLDRLEIALNRPDIGGSANGGLSAIAYDQTGKVAGNADGPPSFWDVITTMNWDTNLQPGGLLDSWTLVMFGFIRLIYDETYTFYLSCEDGATLQISSTTVLSDYTAGVKTLSGTFSPTGTYALLRPIAIKHFFDNAGTNSFMLEWESASQVREVVPGNALFYETPRWMPLGLPSTVANSLPQGGGTFQGSFVNKNPDRPLVMRKLASGLVEMKGELDGSGNVILLPVGYRTNSLWVGAIGTNSGAGTVNIDVDAILNVSGGGNPRYLDGIRYYAYE